MYNPKTPSWINKGSQALPLMLPLFVACSSAGSDTTEGLGKSSGGTSATGGAPTGGNTNINEGEATGGRASTGGAAPLGSGGESASGGTSPSGGAPSLPEDCRDYTEDQIRAAISPVPAGQPTVLETHYDVVKYLHIPSLDVHIFGAKNVLDWTLVGAHRMACGTIMSLNSEDHRKAFQGYDIFAITNDDPDVPGGRAGHKNTGGSRYTIFNQHLICANAVDTIRPSNPPEWRAWDTPVHELGHGVEHVLDLFDETSDAFSVLPSYDPTQREYFAWAMDEWFDGGIKRPFGFRETLPEHKRDYMGQIFDSTDSWRPSCDGKP